MIWKQVTYLLVCKFVVKSDMHARAHIQENLS